MSIGAELSERRGYKRVQLDHANEFDAAVVEAHLNWFGNLQPHHTILDLGTGRGVYTQHLRERGFKAYGVDLRSVFMKREKYFINADARQLPYPDNSFDFVVESLMFRQMREIDHDLEASVNALKEMKRVLKPRGIFLSARGGVSNSEMKELGSTNMTPDTNNYYMYQLRS